ncbi:hypothetical protein MHI39_24155 [Heyndrickxia sp. FSL K6-6286]|uniref:NUDIX hydrolase n=1 Tax=Heyndrickxia sp. FSL K6-6286 TaxID=2921510 RepID=UPI00315A3DC9
MNKVKINKIPNEVKITISDKPMYLPVALQESINSYWEFLTEKGKMFYRGELFSIKEMKETGTELLVTLQRTDYAHFLFSKYCKIPNNFKCRVIVANGLILTKDNFFILGEMNNQTSTPGRIQFIAGGIDDNDIIGNTVDIFSSLIREAKEEIGLDLNNQKLVQKVEPRYIVHWGNIALVYLIQLNIDSVDFLTQYKQFEKCLYDTGIEPEFSSIVLLSADYASVSDFLRFDERPKLDFLATVLKKEMKIK